MSKLNAKVLYDLTALGLAEGLVTEYRFHPERRWLVDFSWPAEKLALEVNGGTYLQGHRRGAHSRGGRQRKDYEKWTQLSLLGWKLILVDTVDVRQGEHVTRVMQAMGKDTNDQSH